MTAISTQSNNSVMQKSGATPFKTAGSGRVIKTSSKSDQFLGDEDLNDRVEFSSSFKQESSKRAPVQSTPAKQAKKNFTTPAKTIYMTQTPQTKPKTLSQMINGVREGA